MTADRRSRDHAAFRLLAAAAVDGWIDPFDAADLEAHLAGCPACRADQQAMLADHEWLASPARPTAPDPRVRTEVLQAARTSRVPRTSSAGRPWSALAAAALVVAVAAGGLILAAQVLPPAGSVPTASTRVASTDVAPTDGIPFVQFTGQATGRDETPGSIELRVSVEGQDGSGGGAVEVSLDGEDPWSGTILQADFGFEVNANGPYATASIHGCRAGSNPCVPYRLVLVDDSDRADEDDEVGFWFPQEGATDPPDATHRYQVVVGDIVVGMRSRPSSLETAPSGQTCSGSPFAPAAVIGTSSAGLGPWAMAAADMNGDALIDLVILNKEPGSLGIMLGDGRGGFSQPHPITPPDPNPLAGSAEPTLIAADVTNDGQADVLVANQELGIVVAFVGDGAGGLEQATSVSVGGQPGRIAVGEYGGDGNPDLAVADESGGVLILMGAGTGSFEAMPRIELGGSPRGIAAGDLNGDGRADLVVGHDGDHRVEVLLGAGNGTFGPSLVLEGLAATDVNLVDVDTDGDLDALLANSGPDSVSIMLGDGAGSFGQALVHPLQNGAPGSIAAIDLDGDGDLDIIANDGVSNDLGIFLGDGRGGFEILERMPASGGPTGLVAGDFDRDGRPDVATSNANSSSVSVFLNRCGATLG